jgi:hypothetical protein
MKIFSSATKLLVSIGIAIGCIETSSAVPLFFQTWSEEVYPNSNSDDIGCQLCHQSSEGGDGWNAYGTDIWFFYNEQQRDIKKAFAFVESINSDNDAQGLSNLDEIERSMNPGWVNTSSNNIYYKDGRFLENQAPPFIEVAPSINIEQEFCFSLLAKNKKAVVICL